MKRQEYISLLNKFTLKLKFSPDADIKLQEKAFCFLIAEIKITKTYLPVQK
jgi:hypothetical protein